MNNIEKEIALQQERFDEAVKYAEANPNPEFPFHFANDEAAYAMAKEDIENGIPYRPGYLSHVNSTAASDYAEAYAVKEQEDYQERLKKGFDSGHLKEVGKVAGNTITLNGNVKVFLPVINMTVYTGAITREATKLAEFDGDNTLSFETEEQYKQRIDIDQAYNDHVSYTKVAELFNLDKIEYVSDFEANGHYEIWADNRSVFLVER